MAPVLQLSETLQRLQEDQDPDPAPIRARSNSVTQVTESGQAGLAGAFVDIARRLQAETTLGKTPRRATEAAVATVDGCDHAAISITRRRSGLETVAATDEVPPRVDAIQCETGEGPCLTGIFEHEFCRIDDLAGEQRWPAFCRRAVEEIGVRSMLSFRLCMHGGTAGVLTLYGRHPAVFGEYSQAVGGLLAAHAAIALSAVREQERADNLEDALRSSREIGMAIGVLMGRDTMTREGAFGLMRQTSQHLNRKLREIAAEVVDTGQLPGRPLPRQRE